MYHKKPLCDIKDGFVLTLAGNDWPVGLEKDPFANFYFFLLSHHAIYIHQQTGAARIELRPKFITKMLYILFTKDASLKEFHRTDGPAKIGFNENAGKLTACEWWINGVAHRDEQQGPQEILYYPVTGKVRKETYRINGLAHREGDKPAIIHYWENGQTDRCEYCKKDKLHREQGPASTVYTTSGVIRSESWYQNGCLHRLDGPAYTLYKWDKDEVFEKQWWVNGSKLNRRRLPSFENGCLVGNVNLTKASLVRSTLFDRDYGRFVRDKYDELCG